jgi:hypothetical protein
VWKRPPLAVSSGAALFFRIPLRSIAMQTFFRRFAGNGVLLALAAFVGCQTESSSSSSSGPTPVAESPPETGDEHAHSHAEAPHGGHLIELGRNHEYHAELVEDHTTEKVTIYILDKDMKPLAIAAENVTFNLAGDEPQSFELAPADAADGKASSFVTPDTALMEALEKNPEAKGRLEVTIDGVPYNGELVHHEHDHDHEGHKH